MEVVASLSQGRTAAAQCGLFTHKSVPVIFEPPCIMNAPVEQLAEYFLGRKVSRTEIVNKMKHKVCSQSNYIFRKSNSTAVSNRKRRTHNCYTVLCIHFLISVNPLVQRGCC